MSSTVVGNIQLAVKMCPPFYEHNIPFSMDEGAPQGNLEFHVPQGKNAFIKLSATSCILITAAGKTYVGERISDESTKKRKWKLWPHNIKKPKSMQSSLRFSKTNRDIKSIRKIPNKNNKPLRIKPGRIPQVPKHIEVDYKQALYKCTLCMESFPYLSHASKHLRVKHVAFQCELCDRTFRSRRAATVHHSTHTGLRPFTCDVCKKTFRSKGSLSQHKRTHNNIKPHTCSYCDKAFYTKQKKTIHERRMHTKVKPFKCTYCPREYAERYEYNHHLRYHMGDKPFLCDICGHMFTENHRLQVHIKNHHEIDAEEGSTGTPLVTKTGRRKRTIYTVPENGMRLEDGTCLCRICGVTFKFLGTLVAHMRCHTGQKPFKCEYCEKYFRTYARKSIHERIHKGDRRYVCSICNKGFIIKTHLNNHMVIHTGLKVFQCENCGKSFNKKANLDSHKETHQEHKFRYFECEDCGITCVKASEKKSLRDVRSIMQCQMCGKDVKIIRSKSKLREVQSLEPLIEDLNPVVVILKGDQNIMNPTEICDETVQIVDQPIL